MLRYLLGKYNAILIYVFGILLTYISIAVWVAIGNMPLMALLGLVPLPVALLTIWYTIKFGMMGNLTLALWANGIVFTFTIFLLALGYIISGH